MTYLDSLLAGYRKGLAAVDLRSLDELRAALDTASDPEVRGHFLGAIAALLAEKRDERSNVTGLDASPLRILLSTPANAGS